MRAILKKSLINASVFFIISQLIDGLVVEGGLQTYIIGGLILTIISFLKPLMQLIALPLNAITLGTFSFLINAGIFYILTIIVPQIIIRPFILHSVSLLKFSTPQFSFNLFLSFVFIAFIFSIIVAIIEFITKG